MTSKMIKKAARGVRRFSEGSETKPPKHILCRLADLMRELKDSAALFRKQGNDDAEIATSACAERLHEVVTEYLRERDAFISKQAQPRNAEVRQGE